MDVRSAPKEGAFLYESPTKHKHGLVAILDALGAAAYGPTEIDRFMDSRDVVLRLAQEKAEEMLEVNLMSTFTFNDTIVFALELKLSGRA